MSPVLGTAWGCCWSHSTPSALPWSRRGLETLPANVSFAAGCHEPLCQSYSRAEVVGAVRAADVVVVCLGTGRWQLRGHWVGTT